MNDIHQNLVGARSKNSARTQSRNLIENTLILLNLNSYLRFAQNETAHTQIW